MAAVVLDRIANIHQVSCSQYRPGLDACGATCPGLNRNIVLCDFSHPLRSLIPPDADPPEVVPEFVPELELFPLPVAFDA